MRPHRSCSRWRSSGETSVKITSPGSASMIASTFSSWARRADEEPDVLDRHHVLELGHGGARDRRHRLAGRVRDQVQVEPHGVACPSFGDKPASGLWTTGGTNGRPVPAPTGPPPTIPSRADGRARSLAQAGLNYPLVGRLSTDTRRAPTRSALSAAGPRRFFPVPSACEALPAAAAGDRLWSGESPDPRYPAANYNNRLFKLLGDEVMEAGGAEPVDKRARRGDKAPARSALRGAVQKRAAGVADAPGRPLSAGVPGSCGPRPGLPRPLLHAGARGRGRRCSRSAASASTPRSCSPTSWWSRTPWAPRSRFVEGEGPKLTPLRERRDLDAAEPDASAPTSRRSTRPCGGCGHGCRPRCR